jgi:hypothetical protein
MNNPEAFYKFYDLLKRYFEGLNKGGERYFLSENAKEIRYELASLLKNFECYITKDLKKKIPKVKIGNDSFNIIAQTLSDNFNTANVGVKKTLSFIEGLFVNKHVNPIELISIERKLKVLIVNILKKKYGSSFLKKSVHPNLIERLKDREKVDRKRMSKSVNNPSHDDNLIQQSGLAECQEIILKNFNLFKSTFGLKDKSEKNLLVTKFDQLFAYRNAFMHDKPIKNDEVIMNEGKAALVWFKRTLSRNP